MSETIRRGEFRPVASPRQVAANPARPAMGPEPTRRPDPVAPTPTGAPRQPNVSTDLADIARSLAGFVPNLNAALASYGEGVRQVEGAEAEGQATTAAMQADVRSWADAVRRDPSLADRSPYFRQIYESRLARSIVQREGTQALARYYASDIAASEDPGAIQGFLSEQFRDSLESFRSNPAALAAASEELRNQTQFLTRTHTQNAARNLVTRNETTFGSAVSAALDQANQQGWSVDQMGQRLEQLQAEGRAQGVDGAAINRIMTQGLAEAMVRTMNPGMAALGLRPRPDGTPGFASAPQFRQIISSAEDRIQSRRVQASNLAYTQERRAQAAAERTALGTAADFMLRQIEAGSAPELTPQIIAQIGRVNPTLAAQAMELNRQLGTFMETSTDNRRLVTILESQVSRGEDVTDGLTVARLQRRITDGDFSRLMGLARAVRNDNFLNDGAVQAIINSAADFAGRPDPMLPGNFANPMARMEAANRLRVALIEERQRNPGQSAGFYMRWLTEQAEAILPGYVARDQLAQMRADIQNNARTNQPPPARPGAPGGAAAPGGTPGPVETPRPVIGEGQQVTFPANMIATRPNGPGTNPTVIPFTPGRVRPNEQHIRGLVEALRRNPNDAEAIERFDRSFGMNAAYHFVQLYNQRTNR